MLQIILSCLIAYLIILLILGIMIYIMYEKDKYLIDKIKLDYEKVSITLSNIKETSGEIKKILDKFPFKK